jgi:hypothetical protein
MGEVAIASSSASVTTPGDQVHALTEERRLKAVGDEPGHLLAEHLGLLAHGGVEVEGTLDGLGRGLLPRYDLHQTQKVRGG